MIKPSRTGYFKYSPAGLKHDGNQEWLRKETVNAHQLYFTIAEKPNEKLTKDEVLNFKDKEWIEKSVAMSEACSLDVITNSIFKLNELKKLSPSVPHKILAIGCSIKHAEDLFKWYQREGLKCVIVHSEMASEAIEREFEKINNHECNVVISVNMLMEGYDHCYLSILALFRPYRSINAFAQVIGRILRAIPERETTAFEVDNNAVVIYHEETGLNFMWKTFQKEVDRAKYQRVRDYPDLDIEYAQRERSLAGIDTDNAFISEKDSYLDDVDFNELFESKRREISDTVTKKLEALRMTGVFSEEDVVAVKDKLIETETTKISTEIDPAMIAKRPAQARNKLRELLTKKVQDEVASLLCDLGLDEKGAELAIKFMRLLPHLKPSTPNDGVLVIYINAKLAKKYGRVDSRENDILLKSLTEVTVLIEEIRKMLSC